MGQNRTEATTKTGSAGAPLPFESNPGTASTMPKYSALASR